MLTTCKQNLGVAPWRRKFKKLTLKLWCSSRYGTAVEDSSLPIRSGICDGIICCNFVVVHTAILSIKIAFNLAKIHLFFRIMLLIQWSVIFLSSMLPFLGDWNIYPSVFRIYADIHGWRTNENLCNKLNP